MNIRNLSTISDVLLNSLNRRPPDSIHEIINKKAQKEILGYLRKAGYYFDNDTWQVDGEVFEQDIVREAVKHRRLDLYELSKQALSAPRTPVQHDVNVTQYARNSSMAEYAKRRADGVCDLCGEGAPFLDRDRMPFLESHHIVWFSQGGEDTINNTVALCLNCHRKMHVVGKPEDVALLKERAKKTLI